MKKKIKINCLSNSLEDRPLPDYLYNQYGYNNIINMKNHNIGITDLNNNNSSKKKNGIYRISKNSNDSPISQKNKVIFPAIKNNRDKKTNLEVIEENKRLDVFLKIGKNKVEKEKHINYLNNNDNSIKKGGNILVKNKSSISAQDIKSFDDKYIIEMQKRKIKDLEEKIKHLTYKEEELKKRSFEIEEREKIFNKKISFLEDKENMTLKEYENLKKEITSLDMKYKKLEKEIKEKEEIKKQIEKFIKNNHKEIEMIEENKKLIQDNSILKGRIKELEEENEKLKNDKKKIIKLKLKSKSKDNILSFKNPTLIGLNNIGATCFMNSTLQCLSQTKDLTYYFLNKNNKDRIINNNIALKNKDDLQLSPIYLELIKNLWDENGPKSFSPNKFMNTIEKMNLLFKTGQAGDAKDFIIFILEQIHKELKTPINNIINININNQQLNQYDKNNAFNYFLNEFRKECSIISDIFFGFNETTNECLNCKNIYNSKGINNPICYNYGIFNCLIFPLEEVKNMKNNSNQYNDIQNNNNVVSLYDCFYYNQKNDLFTGENKNYCNICKQLFDSIYTSKIFISPNVLVLILNRGRGNIYNVKLDFCDIIDITQFVQQKDCPQLIYNLYGVITHIGQSGPNAHFVASCKSPIDNKWYRYNDAFVNPIIDLKKEVIDFETPYILFYQKNLVKNN